MLKRNIEHILKKRKYEKIGLSEKLSDIKNSSTGTNNSGKPYLENTIGTTKTTTTTAPPPKATSRIKITATTATTLGQHSNSEDVPVSPESGLNIIFFLLSDMMSVMDVFHARRTSFMSDIFTLPLAKL